jgi:hypothetical protein
MAYSDLTEARNIFSDHYKDANGFRPRFDRSDWTLEDYNSYAEGLDATIDRNNEYEAKARAEATSVFMSTVETCKKHGAKDDADAIRWMLTAEDITNGYDFDYWIWDNGLAYTPYANYIKAIAEANQLI